MNRLPFNKLSKASQLSLVAVVLLLGVIFFTVNNALEQQNRAGHASGNDCTNIAGFIYCPYQPYPSGYSFGYPTQPPYYRYPTPTPYNQNCKEVLIGFTYTYQCYSPTPVPTAIPITKPTCAPPPTCYNSAHVMFCLMPAGGWCGFNGPTSTPIPTTPVVTPTCAPPPSCYSGAGVMRCLMPFTGWCGFNPTAAPTQAPTEIPTSYPTPFPTEVPSVAPTAIPTAVPQPTETPVPGSTVLAINVGLHGIGNGGDSASPNSQGNMDPLRPTRSVTADVYDTQNQLVVSQQGSITYNSSSGRFEGTIDLGTSFHAGEYTVKIKTDQYLRALVPGIQNISAGQTNTLPDVTLIAGDINGDNAINIIDYNILIGCYSDLLPATDCNATNNVLADLNDDGHVNQFDYNLFLRELTNIAGE